MMSRFSNDSSVTQLGLIIRISGTMHRLFDRSHPDRKWGDAFPLEYMVVGGVYGGWFQYLAMFRSASRDGGL